MSNVTQLLNRLEAGESQAAAELLPLVYDELRKLAARKMAQEKPGQTLQATALVHEAYLRLVKDAHFPDAAGGQFANRAYFFAAAAEAMRRILVDRAREKAAAKRGGQFKRLNIDAVDLATTAAPEQLLALDEALAQLASHDPAAARLVELRYFAGMTIDDAGRAIGISTATAYRHWNYARAWLHSELLGDD